MLNKQNATADREFYNLEKNSNTFDQEYKSNDAREGRLPVSVSNYGSKLFLKRQTELFSHAD